MRGEFDDDDEWPCFEDACVCTDGMCGESAIEPPEMVQDGQ